jgi:hypothetical protein
VMMKDVERFIDRDGVTHAGPYSGYDAALCGYALEGENGDAPMTPTLGRISCETCIALVHYARSIPLRTLARKPRLTTKEK